MANGITAVISLIFSLLIIAAMQVFRTQFDSSQPMTIFGGFLGSNLFVFLLTAISNFEMEFFGDNYKAGLFPEVTSAIVISVLSSCFVHRVCASTCFLFSLAFLYILNNISKRKYSPNVFNVSNIPTNKKRK